MPFDMSALFGHMESGLSTIGDEIAAKINTAAGQELSEIDMLKLQHSTNRWNIMLSMQTNLMKTWADAMKSITANMR